MHHLPCARATIQLAAGARTSGAQFERIERIHQEQQRTGGTKLREPMGLEQRQPRNALAVAIQAHPHH